MISGTQGEPCPGSSRAAVNNHKHAHIDARRHRSDELARHPRNEKGIFRMIDHLCRRDANVIFDDGSNGLIHVSGHGSQEELRLMINLVRPRFFIPIHGDYRHLKKHIELAAGTGIPSSAFFLKTARCSSSTRSPQRKTELSPSVASASTPAADTQDVVDDIVIRDRKHLSEDGIVLPIVGINQHSGRVEGIPEIVTLASPLPKRSSWREARQIVMRTLDGSSAEEKADYGVIKEKIRADLKRYIQKNT